MLPIRTGRVDLTAAVRFEVTRRPPSPVGFTLLVLQGADGAAQTEGELTPTP